MRGFFIYSALNTNLSVFLLVILCFDIITLHTDLLSPALGQALMAASLTPQTHSPPIIAPPEFIVCVTCRPSFTIALVRVSKSFNAEAWLYCPPTHAHRDTWRLQDTSGWQYLTWRCSFFHPPSFQRHLLTLPSLPRAQITVQPSAVYALTV